jgi:hypothetical protein
MKLKLNNVRAAFMKVWKAEPVNAGDKPVFGCSFLIDPTDPQIKTIKAALKEVATEKWGAKAAGILKELEAGGKLFFKDGNSKASYEGFENMMFISASSSTRPLTLNRDKSPVAEEDGVLYSGCYVNVSLELWAQDNNWGKRINAQIGGVQFFKDGDAFAGGGSAADEDDFDELEAGADADGLV